MNKSTLCTILFVALTSSSHANNTIQRSNLLKALQDGTTYENSRFDVKNCELIHKKLTKKESKCNDKKVYALVNTYDLKFVKTEVGAYQNTIKLSCTNNSCRKMKGDFNVSPYSCSSKGKKVDRTYSFGYLSMKNQRHLNKTISTINKMAKTCK